MFNEMKRIRIISVLMAALSVISCHDDWSFSADSRFVLDFSADTVRMDTVFTGVASATACFMVYNTNDVGLRFDAFMNGGAGSPFRMNLDGQGGIGITGLEIPSGDSLYCFVSVNIPETGDPELFSATDSIRFVLESGNVQYVKLSAFGQNAVRLKGRRIESDTTLSGAIPYLVFDSLYVAEGATLILTKGTRLFFHAGAVLDVAGRLLAQGSADSMIVFRGDRLDATETVPPVKYDLLASQWGGIRIRGGSYDNVFSFCDIHGGKFGIKADRDSSDHVKFSVSSSIVHNVAENCIEATGCSIRIANSQITNAGAFCVDVAGGWSDFTFCTIAGFSLWTANSQAVLLSDSRDNKSVQFIGAQFRNCIITGRHQDEFLTMLSDSVKKTDSYCVSSSLVMTSDTTDIHFRNVAFDRHGTSWGGPSNFRDNTVQGYASVFYLDSLSHARGIADSLSVEWPIDLRGVSRPTEGADAGCYQFFSD